jgi:hypothetical protein
VQQLLEIFGIYGRLISYVFLYVCYAQENKISDEINHQTCKLAEIELVSYAPLE